MFKNIYQYLISQLTEILTEYPHEVKIGDKYISLNTIKYDNYNKIIENLSCNTLIKIYYGSIIIGLLDDKSINEYDIPYYRWYNYLKYITNNKISLEEAISIDLDIITHSNLADVENVRKLIQNVSFENIKKWSEFYQKIHDKAKRRSLRESIVKILLYDSVYNLDLEDIKKYIRQVLINKNK